MTNRVRLERSYHDWLRQLEREEEYRKALEELSKEVQRETREGYGDN